MGCTRINHPPSRSGRTRVSLDFVNLRGFSRVFSAGFRRSSRGGSRSRPSACRRTPVPGRSRPRTRFEPRWCPHRALLWLRRRVRSSAPRLARLTSRFPPRSPFRSKRVRAHPRSSAPIGTVFSGPTHVAPAGFRGNSRMVKFAELAIRAASRFFEE